MKDDKVIYIYFLHNHLNDLELNEKIISSPYVRSDTDVYKYRAELFHSEIDFCFTQKKTIFRDIRNHTSD